MLRALVVAAALTVAGTGTADPAYTLSKDTLVIQGPIRGNIVRQANDLLKIKQESPSYIDIVINSPGGSVYAGWQFVNAMKIMQNRGYKLRCLVTTMAASMAYQILSECDERYAFRYSTLLWHPVRLSGSFTLTPKQALGIARQLKRIETMLVDDLRKKFEVNDKVFWRHYHAETLHVAAQIEALSGDYIKIVNDVGGIESLSNLRVIKKKNTKIKPRKGVGPKGQATPSQVPDLDIFIYMHPEAYRLWRISNH